MALEAYLYIKTAEGSQRLRQGSGTKVVVKYAIVDDYQYWSHKGPIVGCCRRLRIG